MDPQPLDQFVVDTPSAAPPPPPPPPPQQFYASAPPPQQFYTPAPPRRKSTSRVLTALIVVLLVVAVLYLCFFVMRGGGLADALAVRGWVLYTRPGCPYCAQQMDFLGGAYPNHVDCGKKNTPPAAQGPYPCKNITAYPFWVNENTMVTHAGLQDRDQLVQMLESSGSS